MSTFRQQIAQRVRGAQNPAELGEIIAELIERIERAEGEAPLIDGCRIIHRGDGFDVCKVHYRHWKTGTEKCPGSQGR